MAASTDGLKELVQQAQDAAAELLKADPELGRIAFREILGHLLRELQLTEQANGAAAAIASSADVESSIDETYATEEQRAWAVAQSFNIDIHEARDLFDLSGPDPMLQVHSKSLAKQRSTATREIALLVCGARTALGLDTGTDHIRVAAERHNRLDPPNFMKTLGAMKQIVVRGSPGSHNRLVRLKVTGVEKARELAAQLTN